MDKDAALEELLSTIDELSLKQFRYGTPEYDCQQVMMRAAARFRRAVAVKIINEGSNSDISLDGIHKFLLKIRD